MLYMPVGSIDYKTIHRKRLVVSYGKWRIEISIHKEDAIGREREEYFEIEPEDIARIIDLLKEASEKQKQLYLQP